MNLSKTSFKRTVFLLIIVGFAFSPAFIRYFSLRPTQNDSALLVVDPPTIDKEKVNPGLPTRLKIPKINVDAAIEHVGLTSGGDMDIPKGPTTAGWFSQGPRPGANGSAVIDGHFGYRNDIPAIFDNLHTLQKGDNIYVEDDKGAIIIFVVRESRQYSPNENTSSIFTSNDGKTHLNLITCQGIWSNSQRSYSKRLVVFADKEIE